MSQSLRIGVAGLGTVGAALVRMIGRRREALLASGLDVTVTAVSARDRSRIAASTSRASNGSRIRWRWPARRPWIASSN